ncbi:triphosphoribosyl-dephospho-CoA synthase, partial [Pseudomonas sp. Kh13]|uniref:triphosphoribosyl-dephospho-CoA synthase n=1 Tax=Pseudomonas sp. Kh13 TaxID=2093744 RepID=UPI0015B4D0DE
LTAEDTDFLYKAIRLASPSAMGHVPEHDLYSDGTPEITLQEVMKLAADRDMVAKQYVNNFRQVLDEGYQALVLSLDSGLPLPQAIAQT